MSLAPLRGCRVAVRGGLSMPRGTSVPSEIQRRSSRAICNPQHASAGFAPTLRPARARGAKTGRLVAARPPKGRFAGSARDRAPGLETQPREPMPHAPRTSPANPWKRRDRRARHGVTAPRRRPVRRPLDPAAWQPVRCAARGSVPPNPARPARRAVSSPPGPVPSGACRAPVSPPRPPARRRPRATRRGRSAPRRDRS